MDIHAFVEVGPSRLCWAWAAVAFQTTMRLGCHRCGRAKTTGIFCWRVSPNCTDWASNSTGNSLMHLGLAPGRDSGLSVSAPTQLARRRRKMIRPGASIGSGQPCIPLLGSEIASAVESTLYRVRLSLRSPKYLVDHQVQGSVIVPAAAYIEQGLAAAQLAFGTGRHGIEDLAIQQPMFLPAEGARDVELVVAPENGGRSTFETYSISAENADPKSAWTMHASGAAVPRRCRGRRRGNQMHSTRRDSPAYGPRDRFG